jgi:hypothetical protein
MTPPTLTPAEQIRRFVEQHPGEWMREESPSATVADVLPIFDGLHVMLLAGNVAPIVWVVRSGGEHVGFVGHHVRLDAPLLTRIASRVADCLQLRGGSADTLPPWLADPVRHQLINRARALLTSAGISPTDAVMAAETLDEALCQRAPVAPADVINALQAIGMSCRWIQEPAEPMEMT